ncbi:MAG: hypothetical protein ACLQVD_05330 [Capsulimonadaceae bacterium]
MHKWILLATKGLPWFFGAVFVVSALYILFALKDRNTQRAIGFSPIASGSLLVLLSRFLRPVDPGAPGQAVQTDISEGCVVVGLLLILAQAISWTRAVLRAY